MTSMKTVQIWRLSIPFSIYVRNYSTPSSWAANFKPNSPFQMITNQLKENMIQGSLLYPCYQQSNYRIIIHLQWSLMTLSRMGHWPGYLWWLWLASCRLPHSLHMPYLLSHKQFNGIIKGWLHCLTSEPKGRFVVNNILMFGSVWYLVLTQIQFFFNKRNKDWTSRTLTTQKMMTLSYYFS